MTTTHTPVATSDDVYEVFEMFLKIEQDGNGNDVDEAVLSKENAWTIPASEEALDDLLKELRLRTTEDATRGEDSIWVDLPYIQIYRYVD